MAPQRLINTCLILLTALVGGCGASSEEEELVAPPSDTIVAAVSLEMPATADNTPPAADAQSATIDPSVLSTTDPAGYTKKDLDNIIQHLDWHAENYISQKDKIPTMDELKAWRDPSFQLGLPEWPKPPVGKKWVMNEQSGQFSLADEAAAK